VKWTSYLTFAVVGIPKIVLFNDLHVLKMFLLIMRPASVLAIMITASSVGKASSVPGLPGRIGKVRTSYLKYKMNPDLSDVPNHTVFIVYEADEKAKT
jgi:hypothetical protein